MTPSLLKDDETVDVGLKQLWPTQAAWLWPTQAAWNVVFQCCDDEVPARRVGSAATGGAPDTAPAEDDGRPRAFQPGEDHVLVPSTSGDDPTLGDDLTERVLRELRDEGLPTGCRRPGGPGGRGAVTHNQWHGSPSGGTACRRDQAAACRGATPTGEVETFYVGDMQVRLPRPGDTVPQLPPSSEWPTTPTEQRGRSHGEYPKHGTQPGRGRTSRPSSGVQRSASETKKTSRSRHCSDSWSMCLSGRSSETGECSVQLDVDALSVRLVPVSCGPPCLGGE